MVRFARVFFLFVVAMVDRVALLSTSGVSARLPAFWSDSFVGEFFAQNRVIINFDEALALGSYNKKKYCF